jgi:hypothetical protein
MTIWGLRRLLYRSARMLGDIDAARRGPTALLRRERNKLLFRAMLAVFRALFG